MASTPQTIQIPVDDVYVQDNYRGYDPVKDPPQDAALARSIELEGQQTPIRVGPRDDRGHPIVFGHRRHRAVKLAGLPTIDATVADQGPRARKVSQVVENSARKDPNPIDEARGYAELVDFEMTVEEIAECVGRSAAHIRWRLGLLTLAPDVIDRLASGEVRHTIGEQLVGLDPERQRAVLRTAVNNNLSWDELHKLAQRVKTEQETQPMFDGAAFELQAPTYAAEAKEANNALSVRQFAQLVGDILDGFAALDVEVPAPLAAKVAKARRAVAYRSEGAKRRSPKARKAA